MTTIQETRWPRSETENRGASIGVQSIKAVVDSRACCGCGACVSACPVPCIEFAYGERFNFPKVDDTRCLECEKCLKVCPSAFLLSGTDPGFRDDIPDDLECFLAHANDDDVRNDAASGGFVTSIILHLLNSKQIDGAVVTRCEGDNPLVAESFIATDRASVLSARGSKYAPVSNCTMAQRILNRPGRYVFVGSPCMLEGLAKLQRIHPALNDRIALRIGFVCSGMASRLSTRNYIEQHGKVEIARVRRIAYRGGGWPGRFRVYDERNTLVMDRPLIGGSLTYVVGRDHYIRCNNCLDHWAHFADLVASDPWYDEMVTTEKQGWSAIMVRTEKGQKAVESLRRSGTVTEKPISVSDMLSYNRHLLIDRGHPRHGWMALYQLIFHCRLKYAPYLARTALRGKLQGIRTTFFARWAERYYR